MITAMETLSRPAFADQNFWRLIALLSSPTQCCTSLVMTIRACYAASTSLPVLRLCAPGDFPLAFVFSFYFHLTPLLPSLSNADQLTSIRLSERELQPTGIGATLRGVLIVTCSLTCSVYAIDPCTGQCERIAGTRGEVDGSAELVDGPALQTILEYPHGVVIVDSECSAYITDAGQHAIRRITLPPSYFWTGKTTLHCFR
jgi:hypothetical protein